MLRREGLRRTQISEWRKTREMTNDNEPVRPEKRAAKRSLVEIENDRLIVRNKKLEADLARTRLALEITGKAHALLELISESADFETRPTK